MPEWSRVVNSTIKKYVKGEEPNVLRNRKLTALLMDRGRIKYNVSGTEYDWKVRYKRAPLIGYADGDTLSFPRQNRWKTAELPWRGYASTDSMTKKEKLMNRNAEAIVKLYSNIGKILLEDCEDQFGDELYIDGNASGNSNRIHGLESCLGDADNSINISTGAERAENVADKFQAPDDTYAGLTTQLADYGGTWSGSWPNGTGDANYDFWSPVLVNYPSSAFSGTATWAANAKLAVREGILQSNRNKSRRGMLDLIMVTRSMYGEFLNLLDDNERFIATSGKIQGSLAKFGFSDTVNFDGVEVTSEFGVPDTIGYGINVDMVSLCSMQDQIFVPDGPDYDVASKSWRFSIDFFGNLELNPRYLVKWDDYKAS